MNSKWKPPKSPIGMLQEDLWPDVWKILVACILHNQTSRKQVDKVYPKLFKDYPNPASGRCRLIFMVAVSMLTNAFAFSVLAIGKM